MKNNDVFVERVCWDSVGSRQEDVIRGVLNTLRTSLACVAAMENASLPTDVWDNVTSSSDTDDDTASYLAHIRNRVLKIIYIIIGTLGITDNLFVLVVFALFIKITDKVWLKILYEKLKHILILVILT